MVRTGGNIPQHDKGYIWASIILNGEKSNPIKHRNKAGLPKDLTPFQYIVWRTRYHNYTREGFKRGTNKKRSQIIPVSQWWDIEHKQFQKFYHKTSEMTDTLGQLGGHKIIYKSQSPSYISLTSTLRKRSWKLSQSQYLQKHRNKCNLGSQKHPQGNL